MERYAYDWAEVRRAAMECLGAALDLVCVVERTQAPGYDAAFASLNLRQIRNATQTLVKALPFMGRWQFDCLALASVGEGPRPDFHFGSVSASTAHETAFKLLHAGDTFMIQRLRDALRETGLDKRVNVNKLEELSPQDLRETLIRAARSGPLIAFDPEGLHVVKSWIDREWAAVTADHQTPAAVENKPPEMPNVPDPEGKLVLRLKGNSRALLVYMWKRDNVTLDELRAVLHRVKREKDPGAEIPTDKAVKDAVEYLEQKLTEAGFVQTRIEKNGGLYRLFHPQK